MDTAFADLSSADDLSMIMVNEDLAEPAPDLAEPAVPDLLTGPDLRVLPMLTVTRVNSPGGNNLTNEGVLDWEHYGLNAAGDVNRKGGVTPLISHSTLGNLNRFTFFNPTFSWSDGTPTASTTNTNNGIYITGTDNGVTYIVPAGTTTRTLRLYVGEYRGTGTLIAHLSDNSLPDVTVQHNNNNGLTMSQFTITFRATQAGSLTVSWRLTNDNGGGTTDFMAATYF